MVIIEMENGQNDETEGDVYESDGYTDERAYDCAGSQCLCHLDKNK